jgi:hypothetical protein
MSRQLCLRSGGSDSYQYVGSGNASEERKRMRDITALVKPSLTCAAAVQRDRHKACRPAKLGQRRDGEEPVYRQLSQDCRTRANPFEFQPVDAATQQGKTV